MENIIATLQSNYKVDGEGEDKYVSLYNNKEEALAKIDKEILADKFNVQIDELNFPIILFDFAGSSDGWVFDSKATREDIMYRANDYLEENNQSHIWYFENYTVYEETDVLRFEDNEGDLLGYVNLNDDDLIIELNKGIDPINEDWEDGMGNTINIEGWGKND